ncbi:TraR/DksA family transcriptional regulator [Microbacterium sp. RD1]|uniref:TraR/DksA family transcriptional regulator n=1 Tax=Microbacterium sp. RD1 TaxID=3457313 RepID=UPI003FA5BCC2
MTGPNALPVGDIDLEAARRTLELQLIERQGILRELAPRAIPNVDPVAYATSVATQRTIDQIVAALERLADGSYGVCTGCGATIPAERLEVLPHARTCVACQSRADKS